MTTTTSRIPGLHRLTPLERLHKVAEIAGLGPEAVAHLANTGNLDAATADAMIENVIGTLNVPLGIATNLIVDGQEVLVPMATEESSVVAAVCNAARQCRNTGGFTTAMSGSLMIAQVQLVGVSNPEFARLRILEHRAEIEALCDETDPVLRAHGGGFRDLEVRVLAGRSGPMVIVHLVVDTRDAMGANAVNSMAEAVAPCLAEWTGGRPYLRILSNLADRRLARARATWALADIGGAEVRDGILAAFEFADLDPYRAATHNKGIMNGVSAVVLATGNDTRAVEAGAHAYAARSRTVPVADPVGNGCRRQPDRHVGNAPGGGPDRRRHPFPSHRPHRSGHPGGEQRRPAGADNRCRWPGAEFRRAQGTGHHRYPEGAYGPARQEHRGHGRRGG